MLHACFYTICLVFRNTSWRFYVISGTNLLTRCHSASSLFFAVLCFRKVTQEIFSELDEGVLCIYVLLLHEGQAKNHLLCFPYGWNTHVTFIVSLFMIFRLCFFSCYNMVAKFLLSRLCLSCPCFKFFDLSTQCATSLIKLWWCMSPQKLLFCYHLPTRGRAGVKLGDADTSQTYL
jgi:hypothetical protein